MEEIKTTILDNIECDVCGEYYSEKTYFRDEDGHYHTSLECVVCRVHDEFYGHQENEENEDEEEKDEEYDFLTIEYDFL